MNRTGRDQSWIRRARAFHRSSRESDALTRATAAAGELYGYKGVYRDRVYDIMRFPFFLHIIYYNIPYGGGLPVRRDNDIASDEWSNSIHLVVVQ